MSDPFESHGLGDMLTCPKSVRITENWSTCNCSNRHLIYNPNALNLEHAMRTNLYIANVGSFWEWRDVQRQRDRRMFLFDHTI